MAQTINTNVPSLNAQRNLNASQSSLGTALERLSTGLRINSAKDDAAGLAISSRFTTQINGLNQAVRNSNDGISLAQTAEGALNATGESLQRIRQLALQSGNSTNSASDRAALNAEASALLSEVQRVAQTTQFNGTNLLDGSFSNGQFQVGANAGQTIGFGIGGASTDLLGAYQAAGTAVSTAAFDGDGFTINGNEVGVSVSTSAAGVTAESAAAKATAINALTSTTGVTATATNSVTGIAPVAGQSLANGDLEINGVSVGAVASDKSAVTQGRNVRDAINAISNQTGVIATTAADTGALTLTATDGRDITIAASGDSDALSTDIYNATGLAAGSAPTGNDIETITFSNTSIQNADGDEAGVSTAELLDGDTVVIDGITYEFDIAAAGAAGGDGVTGSNVAIALTQSSIADAVDEATITASALKDAVNGQRTLGNTTAVATSAAGVVTVTDALLGNNDLASAEGTDSDGIMLVANGADGTDSTATTGGIQNLGTITLSSAENFTVGGDDVAFAGMDTAASSPARTALDTVDISTLQGANDAIAILDGALSQVNSIRGDLGAIQNRFEATISNLSITSENLSAARGRILDADFAQESATLSRSSILQQAGISVLAQANSLPQQVLSLLQ